MAGGSWQAPALQEQIRTILDLHLEDQRNAWDMQPDGRYVQRRPPEDDPDALGCQGKLLELAEQRLKGVKRLKRRRPRVINRRN